MKKLLFFLFAVTLSLFVSAQTVVFHEDFELPSGGDSLLTTADSSGFSTTNFVPWSLSSHLAKSGVRSDSNRVQIGKTIYLTSNSFSTVGNTYVILEFAQICKLHFADGGQVEVSTNGGTSWTLLTAAYYQGSGVMALNKFSESSYNNDWSPGDTIIKPTNSWWRNEKFDISTIAANQANVKIRFKFNGSGNPLGFGRYGWLLDDIKVTASPSELVAPIITMVAYPTDTVYSAGPYAISAYVKDNTGIDTVFATYKVGNGNFMQLGLTKDALIDSLYTCAIPFPGWGKKITYYVTAKDASAAHNITVKPNTGYYSFFVKYSNGGTAVIGNGTTFNSTTAYPSPYTNYYGGTKHQMLILASELAASGMAAGPISSVSFNVKSLGSTFSGSLSSFQIDMANTTSTVLNSSSFISGLSTVYGPITQAVVLGVNTHSTTTSGFSWDGSSNLLIQTSYSNANTGTSTDYVEMYNSTTSFVSTNWYRADGESASIVLTASTPTNSGTARPNLTLTIQGTSALTQDAGILQITNPTGGVTAGQAFNLEARIKNYGTVNLAKASIKYSVDGGAPATYAWTGTVSLNTDSVSTPFVINSLNLLVGPHAIKVWSELPNDSADQNSINDTAYINFYACASQLSGTYTIGGTGANFATFAEALVGLTQCGINGAVTFNVAPGNYPEQLTIPEISGASATNTITFKAANNDSTSVVLNYASTAAANWIVKLNGADYITFKNIKFAPADSAYSRAIVITNGATYNQFIGNYFVGYYGTGDNLALINVEQGNNIYNLIKGNRIVKGSRAINIKGTATLPLEFVTIRSNVATDQQVYGIYAQYINNVSIDSNTIIASYTNANKYGIYAQYANHFVKITKNTINLTGGTNMYGILTENSIAADSSKGLIANNMISILNGTGFAYGIRLNSTTKYKVYFNSVVTNGSNATDTRALNLTSTSSRIELLNNNLQSNKYPLYVEGSSDTISNYNNLYSTGSNLAYWGTSSYSTLTALKAATLKDTNSVNINPLFNSLSDLHTFNGLLKGIGKFVSEVNTDIDGTIRVNPPCIGADEFIPPPDDAALVAIMKPIGGCGMSSTEDVKVVIKNVGTAIILPNTMTARYKIDSVNAVVSELVNRTINPGDTIQFTFATKANLAVGNITFADTLYKIITWVDLTGDFAHANDTNGINISSMFLPPAPTANNISIPYASPAVLTAVSNRPLFWYDSPTSTTALTNGPSYTTPIMYLTDTFYVEAKTSQSINAQIGTGTSLSSSTGFPTVFENYWYQSWQQFLYTKAELNAMGVTSGAISSIAFNTSTMPYQNYFASDYNVKIGTTSNGSLSAFTTTNLTNVYGPTSITGVIGWNTIVFSSPFVWDGISNIIIDIRQTGAYGSGNAVTYYTSTSNNSVVYGYSSSNNSSYWTSSPTATTSTSRPNIKLIGNVPGCSSPRVPVIVNVAPQPPYEPLLTKVSVPNQGCGLEMEPVTIKVKNIGTATLSNGLSATYKINNGAFITPEAISTPIPAGDSISFTFNTLANLSAHIQSEVYSITSALTFSNPNNNLNNDTLRLDSIKSTYTPLAPIAQNVSIPYAHSAMLTATSSDTLIWYSSLTSPTALYEGMYYNTPILYNNTTYYVASRAGAPNVKISEITQYKTGTGATPTYPTWCVGADLMEITNVGTAPINLNGWNFQIYGSTPRSYTFSTNVMLGAGQVLVFHAGSGTDDPTNRYYNMGGANDAMFSTDQYGYILRDASNLVIDVVATNGYQFASGLISPTDWSGNIASSSSGVSRIVSDNNLASDWIVATATSTQTMGSVNPTLASGSNGSGCISQRASITVNVGPPPQNDAGVLSIVSPIGSVNSNVSTPVQFKIKNFGLATLNTVKARYKLNGVLKPEFTANSLNLAPGDSTTITLGNDSYPAGVYNIKAWTLNPNNAFDSVPYNDTTSITFNACFNGIYTIGDTVGGNPNNYNFPSFTSAINAISVAGMCSNVTFNVAPGTYTEQIVVPNIPGSGPSSILTFKAANNDSTSVILQYAAPLSTANFTVKLNGSKYIVFNKMTIKSTGTTYGRVVEFASSAKYNTISNCVIQTPVTTSSSFAGIYANGTGLNFNKILNNKIVNGYYGIYYYGVSTSNNIGNIIEGNEVLNHYYYGIYTYYQDTLIVSKNKVSSNSVSTYCYGIYLNYCNHHIKVTKNKVALNGNSYMYGIILSNCVATDSTKGLVANNFSSVNGGINYAYAIRTDYSSRFQYIYNSAFASGNSNTDTRALNIVSSSNNISLYNNNLQSNKYPFYIEGTSVIASNYNNMYSTGTTFSYWNGTSYANLNALKAVSQQDSNSVSINPSFVSISDLHTLSTLLAQKGTPIIGISDDIDGTLRNVTAPAVGAHEVQLIPNDAGVTFIARPNSIETEGNSIPVKVAVMNFGTNAISSLPIYYKVNNSAPVLFTYNLGTPLASLAIDTVFLPNFIVPAGNDTIIAYTALAGDINLFNDKATKTFFGTPLFDAQLVRVLPFAEGCNLTTDTVIVLIKNNGINAMSNFAVSYQRTDNPFVITELYNNIINPGDSAYYAFNAPIDLSVTNQDENYNIKSWVYHPQDNIALNDTAIKTAKSLHTPLDPIVNNLSIPYGTSANLVAISSTNDPLYWYDTIIGGNSVFNGGNYITPYLYATDTFYVESRTGQSINAQIGTGTSLSSSTGFPTVFENYWYQSWQQFLYTKAELNAMGVTSGAISSIAFNTSTMPYQNYFASDYNVKIGTTSNGSLSAFTTTNLINVYGPTSITGVIGWNTIVFSSPFIWDGISNIIIDIRQTGAYGSGNAVTYYTTTPNNSVAYGYSSSNNASYWTSSPTATTSTSRPNIKFIGNISGCASQRLPAIVNVGPQSPKDAGVIEIVTPFSAVNLTNHEVVKVKIKNFGSTPIYGLTMRYKVDNNTVVSQIITDTIAVDSILIKSFTQTVNISSNTQPQSFVIKSWTSMIGDATSLNDTTKKIVINKLPVYCPSSATNVADEDIGNVTFAGINNGVSTPVLANPNANQKYNDYTNLPFGTIQPGMTYPISLSIIFSAGTYDGKVNAYIDYNRNGIFDTPEELVFTGLYNGSNNSTVTGNVTIPFTAVPGMTRMRVVADEADVAPPCGTYSYGETEDYTVNIIPPIPHDAGIAHMNGLNKLLPYYAQNIQQPQFFIRNYGSDTLSGAMVKINVNGTIYDQQWTPPTALQSLGMDSMQKVITIQPGMNYIKAYTVLAGDTNYMNDTISRKVFKEYATTPDYFDNFENNEYFYAIDTADYGIPINNLWKQGVPKASFIPNVPSGTKVWATNLDTNYVTNNTSILYSPVFLINPMQADSLKFWQWRKFGTGATGTIEYKTGSSSWIPLGDTNDVNATNWFNDGAKVWKDSTVNWVKSTYKLSNLTNLGSSVQFRFIFKTTATATPLKYGWTIDDFEVTLLPLPADGGVTAIITPNTTQLVGDSVLVKVTVKNFGTDPLTNIPVKYKVSTGSAIVSGTIPGPLASGASIDYTFAQKYAVATSSFTICAYTTVTGDIYVQNDSTCRSVTVNPAANDVGITEIINPGNNVITGQIVYPKVVIKNFGTTPKTSIPLTYQRNSLTPVTGTWTGNALNIGDTVHYTFTTPFTVSSGSSFSLSAFTTLSNDAYTPNNKFTKTVTICNLVISVINGPSNPDFGQTGVQYFVDSVPNATTYNWTYSGTGYTINGNGSKTITMDFANNATSGILTVTASNATCTGAPFTKTITLGVNEIDGSNFWLGQNLPNPTTGLTTIAYSLPSTGEVSFNIVNLYGQSVYSFRNIVEEGRHMIDLNVNDLAAGVYYYTVEFKGKRLVKKMVVNK